MVLKRSGSGYKVVSPKTGKSFSKKPLPKARAAAQLRAIEANKRRRGKKSW